MMRAHRQMDVGKSRLQVAYGIERRFVIGVGSDEKLVVLVIDSRHIVLHHSAYNRALVPQRDEDGDRFFLLRERNFRDLSPAKAFAAQPGP